MTKAIRLKLLAFALGALILVIGDYLYGTTYYTDLPTTDDNRFLISGCLGFITSVLYLYGIFGYSDGFKDQDSLLKKLTIGGLAVFTIGVAVTHSVASAHMYIFNKNLLSPGDPNIEQVFALVDQSYNVYFLPTMLGLVVGFVSLLIGMIRNETIFSKKALFFFPLLVAGIISALDAGIKDFPILLKSAAWSGVIFNLALIAFTDRAED